MDGFDYCALCMLSCANSALWLMAYGIQWSLIRFAWTYTLNIVKFMQFILHISDMSFETNERKREEKREEGELDGFRVKPGGQLAKKSTIHQK